MNVESVNINRQVYSPKNAGSQKTSDEQSIDDARKKNYRSDSLELSEEAQSLSVYQSRINSGYYDKPEVMRSVAESIINEVS